MVVGMSIVYIFLIILMGLIIISSKIFREVPSPKVSTTKIEPERNDELITVISSAIAVFRSKQKK